MFASYFCLLFAWTLVTRFTYIQLFWIGPNHLPRCQGTTNNSHRVEAGYARKINHFGMGDLGHVVLVKPETWVHVAINQSCLGNEIPINTQNIGAHYQSHTSALEGSVSWLHKEKKIEASHLEPSKTLPYTSLPLADFPMHPVLVTQLNCNYNNYNFQWDLWVLPAW